MEYTQGEWEAKKTDTKNPQYEVQNATTEYPYTIADVYCEGDARLISASPDLYEVLKGITAQFKKVEPLYFKDNAIIGSAEQALAKAEGGDRDDTGKM